MTEKIPTPKRAKPIRLDETAPRPCQAAQLAAVVMRRARVSSWKQFVEAHSTDRERIAALVELTADQQDLLDEHAHLLPQLSLGGESVTVVACPSCNEYGLHGKGTVSTRCQFTLGCDGTPVRAREREPRASI